MSIRVLCFHHLVFWDNYKKEFPGLCTSYHTFWAIILIGKLLGYKFITDDDLDSAKGGKNLLVVFDDEFSSVSEKLIKSLNTFGLKVFISVTGANIKLPDRKSDLPLVDAKKFHSLKQRLFLINHTYSHADLKTLKDSEIYNEILLNREIYASNGLVLSDKIFCLPFGRYNSKVMHVVKDLNYKYLFTADEGIYRSPDFLIKRINIGDQSFHYAIYKALFKNYI